LTRESRKDVRKFATRGSQKPKASNRSEFFTDKGF
jgi:hypothetical protein